MKQIEARAVVALVLACTACGERSRAEHYADIKRAEWSAPCRDTATLLATTAGSPSQRACTNRLHRMRIEITSRPSSEEYGAVVFCECDRGAK